MGRQQEARVRRCGMMGMGNGRGGAGSVSGVLCSKMFCCAACVCAVFLCVLLLSRRLGDPMLPIRGQDNEFLGDRDVDGRGWHYLGRDGSEIVFPVFSVAGTGPKDACQVTAAANS